MQGKPSWCYQNCSGSRIGQGFAADSGDPATATCAIILEMPSEDDVEAGRALSNSWMFNKLLSESGLERVQCLILHVLRCRFSTSEYPKGALRKSSEESCRHWDQDTLTIFGPTVWSVMHDPMNIPKVPQTEEYVRKHLSLMAKFVREGHKPVVLAGNKAVECYAPWLKGGTGTWKNHWWEGVAPGEAAPKSITLEAAFDERTDAPA